MEYFRNVRFQLSLSQIWFTRCTGANQFGARSPTEEQHHLADASGHSMDIATGWYFLLLYTSGPLDTLFLTILNLLQQQPVTESYQYNQISPSRSPSGPTYTQLSGGNPRQQQQPQHPQQNYHTNAPPQPNAGESIKCNCHCLQLLVYAISIHHQLNIIYFRHYRHVGMAKCKSIRSRCWTKWFSRWQSFSRTCCHIRRQLDAPAER